MNMRSRTILCRLLIVGAVGFSCSSFDLANSAASTSLKPTNWLQSESDDESITVAQIRTELAMLRDAQVNPETLAESIRSLEKLELQVFESKALRQSEKNRWQRTINRRIRQLKEDQQDYLEKEAAETDQLVRSPGQQESAASPTRRDQPLGWHRGWSWQGGGRLPGGSWQGSQFSESWGQTWTSGGSQQTSQSNPQDEQSIKSRGQGARTTDGMPPIDGMPGSVFEGFEWPKSWLNNANGPLNMNGVQTGSGSSVGGVSGGVRVGGSSSTSSSSRRGAMSSGGR